MKNWLRYSLLIVLGFLIILTISLQITYSYMKNNINTSLNEANIKNDNCVKVTYKENSKIISLTNSYPMKDELGLSMEPYEFSLNNTCDVKLGLSIYLLTLSDNELEDKAIKYGIKDLSTGEIIKIEKLENSKDGKNDFSIDQDMNQLNLDLNGKKVQNIYNIYNINLKELINKNYALYLWISDEIDSSNVINKNINVLLYIKVKNEENKNECSNQKIAECIPHNANIIDNLYYHDGAKDNYLEANSELEALDNSYRYSNINPHNYICFNSNDKPCPNSNLYRIIGFFPNESGEYETKIIKADYATTTELGLDASNDSVNEYYWNNEKIEKSYYNIWKDSNLNIEKLNGYYLNNYLEEKWRNMIVDHPFQISGIPINKVEEANAFEIYNYEIGNNKITVDNMSDYSLEDITYNSKIGLMYISDYMYAASPKYWIYNELNIDNNWLYNNNWEYTITRFVEENHYNEVAAIALDGDISSILVSSLAKVRPVFYLNNNVKLVNGDGTISNPYIITE